MAKPTSSPWFALDLAMNSLAEASDDGAGTALLLRRAKQPVRRNAGVAARDQHGREPHVALAIMEQPAHQHRAWHD
jgi:hypothetical protein